MEIIPTPLVVLLQLFPFLITAFALHSILFKPMLAYLDERSRAIEGERARAGELEASVLARAAEYEERLLQAKAEIADFRAKRRAEAMARHAEVVNAARAQAEKRLQAALAELQQDSEAARATLHQSARVLGGQIASQVMGRSVAAG